MYYLCIYLEVRESERERDLSYAILLSQNPLFLNKAEAEIYPEYPMWLAKTQEVESALAALQGVY